MGKRREAELLVMQGIDVDKHGTEVMAGSPVGKERLPAAPRKRDRQRTLGALRLALQRLQQAGEKITLKAVADEAKVSAPLINNRYPDFAEQVRAVTGRTVRQQRNEKADLLAKERERNRELRKLVDSQLLEITRLASMNEALRLELAVQKAIAEGAVTRGVFGRKATATVTKKP